MIAERVRVETAERRLSSEFSSPALGHLRPLAKSETQKCQNYARAESVHLRMIDLNLFRVFDAMMLHAAYGKRAKSFR